MADDFPVLHEHDLVDSFTERFRNVVPFVSDGLIDLFFARIGVEAVDGIPIEGRKGFQVNAFHLLVKGQHFLFQDPGIDVPDIPDQELVDDEQGQGKEDESFPVTHVWLPFVMDSMKGWILRRD